MCTNTCNVREKNGAFGTYEIVKNKMSLNKMLFASWKYWSKYEGLVKTMETFSVSSKTQDLYF